MTENESPALVDALQESLALLVKHGYNGQAETVADLLALYATDSDRFRELLHSVDVWGGAGAVWEVWIPGPDNRAFRDAIIRLAAAMDEQGLGIPRSRDIAETFRSWNEAGL